MRLQSFTAPVRLLPGYTILLALAAFAAPCHPQISPSPQVARTSSTTSFAQVLQNHNARRLHILYVHGIGDDGPNDLDSYYLRRGMCTVLHCDKGERDGVETGGLLFANTGSFLPGAPPPHLLFFGQPIFPVDASGHSKVWDASAPFLRRFRLDPGKTGEAKSQPVYVDELNWWPIVFALKCQYMVAADVSLVGPDKTTLGNCSPNTETKKKKKKAPLGPSYQFITETQYKELLKTPKQGAFLNRKLKDGLMDWGFTDAVVSLGPMRQLLLEGLQQLIQQAIPLPDDPASDPSQEQEFIIVTHSLGSYLIFAALDTSASPSSSGPYDFSYVLGRTSHVYFFANQLRLLEMANLDLGTGSNFTQHLASWVNARKRYLESARDAGNRAPAQIVAWNDASDLLTWEVPSLCGVSVKNYTVRNTFNWFGIAEGPSKAHDYYGLNKKVIDEMLHGEPAPMPEDCPTDDAAVRH